jgi:peptide/nickel transport system substrate-binding protein
MVTRRTTLGLIAAAALPRPALAGYVEPNYFKIPIEKGELPPIEARLPRVPRVINLAAMGRKAGAHGGSVRMLISGPKDIRYMTIFGYARLVGYDEKLNLQPDILQSYDIADDRIFTFHLRPGHKWSDGEPLTAEDFRYCFEDVLMNEELSPGGLSPYLRVGGEGPALEVIDPLTVRYTWKAPNPDFLPRLASAQPLYMAMPAHYLKKYHEKYQDKDKLEAAVKEAKAKNWAALHNKKKQQYRPDNPKLPVLDPWRNLTKPPADEYVFERNPYFHRVDENGLQLPYADQFLLDASASGIIPAKVGAGESDLQATGIEFQDYTFLKEAEQRQSFQVKLWKQARGSRIALLPNLNHQDEGWRKILQDARFRRALSLAINRHEINMAVFFGLAQESADTVLPESPLYRPEYAAAWSLYDPVRANAFLDEMGLDRRDGEGIRLLPDGRQAQVIVESAGESTLETDVLELVGDHWRQIGVKLFVSVSQRDVFRSRTIAGQTMMGIWTGLDNAVATSDMSPDELAPTTETQMQWPMCGKYYETAGKKGEAPAVKEMQELVSLLDQWRRSTTKEERAQAWHRMLALYTDQVFSIGTVNGALQPVVVSNKLRNVPDKALYSFDPTSYLGVYLPDTFWFEEPGASS